MSGINKCQLLGRLGNDPEIRYTNNGTAVAKFNLATSETYKDKSGAKQEKTEWHRVTAFGNLAEVVGEYLHKGDQVFVEGKICTRSWEDQSGEKRYTTEINMKELVMLGGKRQAASGGTSEPAGEGVEEQTPEFENDDIPF